MKSTVLLLLLLCASIVASTSAFRLLGVRAPRSIDIVKTWRTAESGVLVAVVATGCVAVSPAMAGDYAAGEKVFNANCIVCHAGGQNVIVPEKTLEKEALEQYLTGGRIEASVVAQVRYGKNAMPSFGGRLVDDDIANVATFVIESSEIGWDD